MKKYLLVVVGYGKGTWSHLQKIIKEGKFDDVYFFGDDWAKDLLMKEKECNWISYKPRGTGFHLLKELMKVGVPNDGQIYVSLISGGGKEHMALLTAIRESGMAYTFAVITKEGLSFF